MGTRIKRICSERDEEGEQEKGAEKWNKEGKWGKEKGKMKEQMGPANGGK